MSFLVLKIVSQKLTAFFFPSDVIKCKKDRSSGAQLCPVCASPKNREGKSLVDVPSASLTCTKPAIQDSLKFKNLTVPDDGDFHSVSPKDFTAPIGSVVLNMTDQTGRRGDLVCNVQNPKEMSPISFDTSGNSTVLKASFSASLVCGINYEHIQQLWSILALYSSSPLKLERDSLATNVPFVSYKYKQIYSDKDELFTNTEAELRADPSWLMQSKVALQLDRTATTLNTLHIQYFTDARIVLPSGEENQARNSWTIISRDSRTQTEHTVLVGGTVELECQATGEPAPAVEWILADGSKVRAPYLSEDGRIMVVKTGTFMLRTADTFDTGLYHCIGTNYDDADTLTFRITVVDPYVEHNSVNGAQLSTFVGSTLYLPCTSTAVPDAAISWVLPERVVLHHSVRNRHIFDNGTLRIQGVTERDSGYFRCVAANQYGVDLLVFQVLVRKDKTTLKKKHVAVGEWEEGDGSGNAVLASAATQTHPSAAPATPTAGWESAASASRNKVAQSARTRSSYGRMTSRHYWDKASRRFGGHRRQFVSSARRIDPQRWAAFLEKTKRNMTSVEKQGEAATKPPTQVHKLSEVREDEEETSGDLASPEEEFMMPVRGTAMVPAPVTAGPELPASSTMAGKAAPLPPPLAPSASRDSRRPQTDPKPAIANSWERADLRQISANGINQSAVSNGVSRTSTLFPAGQRLGQSGEGDNQHLKSVSTTSTTEVTATSESVTSQSAVDKLHAFTESPDKISTKTDHQVPVATVSEPSPEAGHVYSHSTQKQVSPKPLLASAHQQVQVIQDVTTRTPQAQQQYGRRRKISGRRRIVRPGRIPGVKEHRYSSGRPGSVSGSAAGDVQLNMKYVSNLPALNNLSSSINPFSPEAPLSSASTTNTPLEPPAGTQQNTAFLSENNATVRQNATTTAVPLTPKGTQDTPQWKSESSAPFRTNAEGVQPSSIKLPTRAIPTAHTASELKCIISIRTSPALESVSPSIKPTTSARNSQRGEITWEHLFGNGAQKEVLKELPKPQTDVFPPTEVSATLPKTTAALPVPKMPPLHLTPVSTGGNHCSAFFSADKPIQHGSGQSDEHLPAAGPRSSSSPAATGTKGMDATGLKPTVPPSITPQTDTKITRSKVHRVGRKRGQRRRRPPKAQTSQSTTAGHGTAAIPSAGTTALVVTAARSSAAPASPSPVTPLSESLGTVPEPERPVLRTPSPAESAQPTPAAGVLVPVGPGTPRSAQSAPLPPGSCAAPSPTAPVPATPRVSEPFRATSARPAVVCAASALEPTQQGEATMTTGGKSHPKTEKRVTQEPRAMQPTLPAGTKPGAPAATPDMAAPSARHPTPLPAPAAAVTAARMAGTTVPPRGEAKLWPKPSPAGTERGGSPPTVSRTTIPTSAQRATPRAPLRGRDEDSSVMGWAGQRQGQETTTVNPAALGPVSRNHFAKPTIIGGKLAAFTVLADSDAFIPCEATGNPRPTIQWTKISPGKLAKPLWNLPSVIAV